MKVASLITFDLCFTHLIGLDAYTAKLVIIHLS